MKPISWRFWIYGFICGIGIGALILLWLIDIGVITL